MDKLKNIDQFLLFLSATTFKTPFGIISFVILANSNIDRDVSEDGLKIVQSPAIKKGDNFQALIRKEKFQGTI